MDPINNNSGSPECTGRNRQEFDLGKIWQWLEMSSFISVNTLFLTKVEGIGPAVAMQAATGSFLLGKGAYWLTRGFTSAIGFESHNSRLSAWGSGIAVASAVQVLILGSQENLVDYKMNLIWQASHQLIRTGIAAGVGVVIRDVVYKPLKNIYLTYSKN